MIKTRRLEQVIGGMIQLAQCSANAQGELPSLLPKHQSTSIQKDGDCQISVCRSIITNPFIIPVDE